MEYSVEILIKWMFNPKVNPVTKRKILKTGKVYSKFLSQYNKKIKIDLTKVVDNKDPISQELFWITNKNKNKNKKEWIFYDIDKLCFYQDEDELRCFTKESLSYMKKYKIYTHPVSGNRIPEEIFSKVNAIEDKKISNLEEKSKIVFQKLTHHSIFINSEDYDSLNSTKFKKLVYEMKSFYYENLDEDNRKIIDKKNGRELFKKDLEDFENLDNYKIYILDNIDLMIDNSNDTLRIFIFYIIIGALGLVIPKIKEDYPDYSFNF